jgi:hypothetical protein
VKAGAEIYRGRNGSLSEYVGASLRSKLVCSRNARTARSETCEERGQKCLIEQLHYWASDGC